MRKHQSQWDANPNVHKGKAFALSWSQNNTSLFEIPKSLKEGIKASIPLHPITFSSATIKKNDTVEDGWGPVKPHVLLYIWDG